MSTDKHAWKQGYQLYDALRYNSQVVVDMNAIERSIIAGAVGRGLHKLLEEYSASPPWDGKGTAIMHRALAGWVIGAAEKSEKTPARITPISLTPPTDSQTRRSLRVLTMVAELHKAGYQHLRITTGISPSECYWRCSITPVSNVKENGFEPINLDRSIVHYTSDQDDRYFEWIDGPGKNARQLAVMFIERFPSIAEQGVGRDYAYAGWYTQMLGYAENGQLPLFCGDYGHGNLERTGPPPPPFIT